MRLLYWIVICRDENKYTNSTMCKKKNVKCLITYLLNFYQRKEQQEKEIRAQCGNLFIKSVDEPDQGETTQTARKTMAIH